MVAGTARPLTQPSMPLLAQQDVLGQMEEGPLRSSKRRRLVLAYSNPWLPSSPSTSPSLSEVDPKETEWWTLSSCPEEDPWAPLGLGTDPIRLAVLELKKYYEDWKAASTTDDFWHRKSKKTVLSVVVSRVLRPEKSGRPFQLVPHRGMNTEVSLPAGSLCAERAAIARVASDFGEASSIEAIATLDPEDKINPLWPCEVCQSWLSKLRSQSPGMAVIAVSSSACSKFVVQVNGDLLPPPNFAFRGLAPTSGDLLPSPNFAPLPPSVFDDDLRETFREGVQLAEGVTEWPWEAREVVYVDGAWTFLHGGQQNILKAARARGTHLLVGVHSDDLLRFLFCGPPFEDFETRAGRVLHSRHVCSIFRDAPWNVDEAMIRSLNIKRVVSGSLSKVKDIACGGDGLPANMPLPDPYDVPRALRLLEVIKSKEDITERSFHDARVASSSSVKCT